MEEKKSDVTAVGGQEKKRDFRRYAIICLAVILAAAAFGWHSYNIPERRFERAMGRADALMEERNYEEASAVYAQAEGIDGVSPEALEGHILADLYRADGLAAEAKDIPSRAQACDLYEQVIRLCDAAAEAVQDTADERFAQPRAAAEEKRTALQKEIAADYEKVDVSIVNEDRSGSVPIPDGSEIAYMQYYDLVKVDDEYYPFAETINASLKQQMKEYFEDPENDPLSVIKSAGGMDKDAEYADYVGIEGIYSGEGLLCIRMARVQIRAGVQSNYYCGRTFRLRDGEEVTLGELTEKTDIGLRRLLRHRIRDWIELEGYSDIKKSEVDDYVEDVSAGEFKYCIRDDGTVCLIIDQSVPFFADRQEIMEIPIQTF